MRFALIIQIDYERAAVRVSNWSLRGHRSRRSDNQ